jgi:hypothetical protein
MLWLCCSSICIITDLLLPKYFGVFGSFPSGSLSTGRNSCLGVWLVVAGFAWVILSLTGVLLPQYQNKVNSYSQPVFFGEIAFMLWLVIKGAKPHPPDAVGLSSATQRSSGDDSPPSQCLQYFRLPFVYRSG